MRQWLIKQIKQRVRDKAALMFSERISIAESGRIPMSNNRCHMNAGAAVKLGVYEKMIECVMLNKNDCTAHYINKTGDEYFDITLGVYYEKEDYRFVRAVDDLATPWVTLEEFKRLLCANEIGFWGEFWCIKPDDIC